MRKAQGALEYLIIIAAVLAIAAIVVLFLTGAFGGARGGGDIASCRLAASTCANNLASGVYASNQSCVVPCRAACANPSGNDLLTTPAAAIVCSYNGAGTLACEYCIGGNTAKIQSV